MKIVCDSCATKYSISDDKVRGKVFKIRCKKCSHIIVVRGTNDGAAAAGQAPASAGQSDVGGWHLVVDGDQVGPLPDEDVRGRISRGEVNGETYVWKDGFSDWVKLSSVAEFGDDLAASSAFKATSAESESEHFAEANDATESASADVLHAASGNNSGGLFGSISVSPAVSDAGESSGFSPSPSGTDFGGGDLFAAQGSPRPSADENHWGNNNPGGASAGQEGERMESLTAQRHENSVLFSLSNLQSLAAPSGAPKPASTNAPSPGSEGSGLIDIRAMAASTLGSTGEGSSGGADDLPSFGGFSPAAPVLLSMPTPSAPSKWIYPAIGLMVVLFLVIGVMAWKIFSDKPAPVVESTPPPAPTGPATGTAPVAAAAPEPAAKAGEPAAVVPSVPPPPPAQPAIPDDKLPPREPVKGAKAESAPRVEHPGKRGKGGKRVASVDSSSDRRPSAVPAVAPAAAPAVDPVERKPAKGSLDDLLEGALTAKGKAAAKPRGDDDSRRPPAEPATSGALSKNAVVSGMNGVKGKVSDCYNQYKVPGMVMVNVVIAKSGKVSTASAQGKFAGTPTGNCVEKAVKGASFPPSDGLTTPYPFVLK